MADLKKWLDQEEIADLPKTAEYFKQYKKSSISLIVIIILILIFLALEGDFINV
jgi:hypothetical protein